MFTSAPPPPHPPTNTNSTIGNTPSNTKSLNPSILNSGHSDIIHDAKMDFYGVRLATASSDKSIKIFSVQPNKENKVIASLTGHEGPVWQVSWSHPKFGSLLASCSYDGKVFIWKEDKSKFLKVKEFTFSEDSTTTTSSKVRGASISSVSWAPHEMGPMLAIACSDGKCAILSFLSEESKWSSKEWNAHQIGSNSCSWGPPDENGNCFLATSGCDNIVRVWDIGTIDSGAIHSLLGHSDWVRDCCWKNKNCIISSSQDRTVNIWKFSSLTKEWTPTLLKADPFHDALWSVEWDNSSKILAVACGDGRISLWKEVVNGSGSGSGSASGSNVVGSDKGLGNAWVCIGNVVDN